MNGTVNLWKWTAPRFDQLVVNASCDASAEYFAATYLFKTDRLDLHYLDGTKSADLGTILIYLDSLIPDQWQTPYNETDNRRNAYFQSLMEWYFGVWKNQTLLRNMKGQDKLAYDTFNNQSMSFGFTCDNRRICDRLELSGDPDVSGRGMVFVYYILAVLTTLYFIVLSLDRLVQLCGVSAVKRGDTCECVCDIDPEQKKSRRHKIHHVFVEVVAAFEGTIDEFLDASLIFAASMLGATIFRYFAWLFPKTDTGSDEIWTYTLLGSALMSTFSVFPCLVLQMATKGSKAEPKRLFLWYVVIILAIIVQVAFQMTFKHLYTFIEASDYLSQVEDQAQQAPDQTYYQFQSMFNHTGFHVNYHRMNMLEVHCTSRYHIEELWKFILVGFGLQAISFFVCLLTLPYVFARKKSLVSDKFSPKTWIAWYDSLGESENPGKGDNPGKEKNSKQIKAERKMKLSLKVLRILVGLIYLVTGWLFLARFVTHRKSLQKYAPSSDQDTTWGFGQILALATWVPEIIDIGSQIWVNIMKPWVDDKVFRDEKNGRDCDGHDAPRGRGRRHSSVATTIVEPITKRLARNRTLPY